MKNKTIQYFSDEYLESCKKMTPEQILNFLESFRILHLEQKKSKSILISIKIPEDLLASFKQKSQILNVPYQQQIKKLMKDWI